MFFVQGMPNLKKRISRGAALFVAREARSFLGGVMRHITIRTLIASIALSVLIALPDTSVLARGGFGGHGGGGGGGGHRSFGGGGGGGGAIRSFGGGGSLRGFAVRGGGLAGASAVLLSMAGAGPVSAALLLMAVAVLSAD